jgi:CDP-glycerol glycerophosphotransferase (TagB/SpsB family)
VFFDFAYLKKPEIFFQFDKEYFFKTQYQKGYFSYEKDGFGDVLTTVDEVVNKIEYYIKNDFKMENKYIKRVEKTFEYFDQNNCKRVYDEILKLNNKK